MPKPADNGSRPADHNPDDDRSDVANVPSADRGRHGAPFAFAEMAGSGLPNVTDVGPPVPINVWRITDVTSGLTRVFF